MTALQRPPRHSKNSIEPRPSVIGTQRTVKGMCAAVVLRVSDGIADVWCKSMRQRTETERAYALFSFNGEAGAETSKIVAVLALTMVSDMPQGIWSGRTTRIGAKRSCQGVKGGATVMELMGSRPMQEVTMSVPAPDSEPLLEHVIQDLPSETAQMARECQVLTCLLKSVSSWLRPKPQETRPPLQEKTA
jgi:hypothetical protein